MKIVAKDKKREWDPPHDTGGSVPPSVVSGTSSGPGPEQVSLRFVVYGRVFLRPFRLKSQTP